MEFDLVYGEGQEDKRFPGWYYHILINHLPENTRIYGSCGISIYHERDLST